MTPNDGALPGHPPTGWTDEDYDGFVADTFAVYPNLLATATVYAGGYENPDDVRVTYISHIVSVEWDLWDGFISHPEAPEPYVEMQLDDEVVAAVRRYIDRRG